MIEWIGSPNYSQGRTHAIDRIVIHWIVGTLASADAVFQKPNGVSAHYGIEDDGVHQYVDEANTAWHAGVGSMNARAIGLEHSASPDRPASQSTIDTSAGLVADICVRYGIPCDRTHIIKHSEVPYNTQCCGTIPIDEIVDKANKLIGGSMITPEQENAQSIMAVGSYPGKDYSYPYVGTDNYDGMINFWLEQAQGPNGLEAQLKTAREGKGKFKKVIIAGTDLYTEA